jgi:Kef-type K+ transport system membrane component KefB
MTDTELAARVFLQVGVVLLVCRVVGLAAVRVGQPQVVAEMVAGFLLGPSFFGWIAPALQAQLFPPQTLRPLFVVSHIGLALYMFSVGLEFRADLMLRNARRAAAVSIAGIAAPFVLGGLLALWLHNAGGFFTERVGVFHAVAFAGAAMSITAFPMLARIIHERGMTGTSLGTLALAAGAFDDACAWIILAIVVGSFSGSMALAAIAAGGSIAYVLLVVWGIRPILRWLNRAAEADGRVAQWMLTSVLAMLAFAAWFTDVVGVHAVFGAFVLGAAAPHGLLSRDLRRLIEPIAATLLLPLFFVYSGLNTRLGLLNSGWLWAVALIVFLAACTGKAAACWLAARLSGSTSREALGVATLMNARGLMELILLNIGLQRGLITPTLFTILAIMTIGTTLMASPLFTFVYGRADKVPKPDSELAADAR